MPKTCVLGSGGAKIHSASHSQTQTPTHYSRGKPRAAATNCTASREKHSAKEGATENTGCKPQESWELRTEGKCHAFCGGPKV